MLAVNLVDWYLKCGVLTNQLLASLDSGTLVWDQLGSYGTFK